MDHLRLRRDALEHLGDQRALGRVERPERVVDHDRQPLVPAHPLEQRQPQRDIDEVAQRRRQAGVGPGATVVRRQVQESLVVAGGGRHAAVGERRQKGDQPRLQLRPQLVGSEVEQLGGAVDQGLRHLRFRHRDRLHARADAHGVLQVGVDLADRPRETHGLDLLLELEQDESGVWTSPSGAKVAWFKDPDGNVLSLTQFGE